MAVIDFNLENVYFPGKFLTVAWDDQNQLWIQRTVQFSMYGTVLASNSACIVSKYPQIDLHSDKLVSSS